MTGTGPLAVGRGVSFTIELPATPTAGYQWQAARLPAGVTLDRTEFRSPTILSRGSIKSTTYVPPNDGN